MVEVDERWRAGLYAEGKAAVARCLLQELKNATVITSDVEAGRRAVPKDRGAFKVITYTTDTPGPGSYAI